MSHSIVRLVLATALATSGTLAVTYPAGFGKGDFIMGSDHRMVALQSEMKVGKDFTISFGNTSATITYRGSTTIPAGYEVIVQLDRSGGKWCDENVLKRSTAVQALLVELGSPATADADGICASQSVSADVASLLNGALATSGVSYVTLDRPRNVVAAWTGTAIITVTGRDEYGEDMIEKSASGTSHTGKKAFKYIDSVTFSANVTGATVGTGDVLGLPFFLRDIDQITQEYQNAVKVGLAPGQKLFLPWEIEATELAAGTAENLVSPIPGSVTDIRAINQEAIGTGGDITAKIGTTDITGAVITIANSATAGTVYQSTAITAANTVVAGSRIQIVPAAAFATTGAVNGTVEITYTGNGDYVVGDQGAVSATSGDPRGTFDPTTACDGVTSFALVVLVDNTNYLGAPQYAG